VLINSGSRLDWLNTSFLLLTPVQAVRIAEREPKPAAVGKPGANALGG
jgi:hypothetical protein